MSIIMMSVIVYVVYIVVRCYCRFIFFFFKQKTAYEMRISDWSSDVCSSDLNLDFEGILLIRDCGFQIEVDPLEEWVGVENLYLVNLFREGCDLTTDSREYVHTNGKMHQVYNDSTLDHLQTEAGRIYGRLVNQCGWRLRVSVSPGFSHTILK